MDVPHLTRNLLRLHAVCVVSDFVVRVFVVTQLFPVYTATFYNTVTLGIALNIDRSIL